MTTETLKKAITIKEKLDKLQKHLDATKTAPQELRMALSNDGIRGVQLYTKYTGMADVDFIASYQASVLYRIEELQTELDSL